ncbi:hypothetical protein FRB96_008060 [Tulasnella sp. 330]|nr:hypothetical protein FRB96_008060 [Tulasnella sp. 330]KAG8873108.1 hypothetical protein FRB97_007013 [Tulasnella sp. 331]
MSRGGRGGGFRGGGRGGGPGGPNAPPPGITYADIQALVPKEGSPLYPPLDSMPILAHITDAERETCHRQVGFAERLRHSPYYIMSDKKEDELERYSDRFKPTARTQPILRQDILNKDFFPASLWEAHFNPKTPKRSAAGLTAAQKRKKKAKIDWSNLEAQEGGADGDEEASQAGGDDEEGLDEVDYDQEDEDFNDNDYENNYFDGGEDENDDDLGDGAVGRDGGGDDD